MPIPVIALGTVFPTRDGCPVPTGPPPLVFVTPVIVLTASAQGIAVIVVERISRQHLTRSRPAAAFVAPAGGDAAAVPRAYQSGPTRGRVGEFARMRSDGDAQRLTSAHHVWTTRLWATGARQVGRPLQPAPPGATKRCRIPAANPDDR
ncbi:hypothetical protein B1987_06895 [Mycobacterium kansasii]|nr:hypothetical protein B1987_06240 [Mycobacterium kansasii]ORB83587.1 hypothetical protein B1987_06895 [Mycobacterium kansasii]